MHRCMYADMNKCVYVCMPILCIHVYVHTCIYECIHVGVYVAIHECIYVYMCVYMYLLPVYQISTTMSLYT